LGRSKAVKGGGTQTNLCLEHEAKKNLAKSVGTSNYKSTSPKRYKSHAGPEQKKNGVLVGGGEKR